MYFSKTIPLLLIGTTTAILVLPGLEISPKQLAELGLTKDELAELLRDYVHPKIKHGVKRRLDQVPAATIEDQGQTLIERQMHQASRAFWVSTPTASLSPPTTLVRVYNIPPSSPEQQSGSGSSTTHAGLEASTSPQPTAIVTVTACLVTREEAANKAASIAAAEEAAPLPLATVTTQPVPFLRFRLQDFSKVQVLTPTPTTPTMTITTSPPPQAASPTVVAGEDQYENSSGKLDRRGEAGTVAAAPAAVVWNSQLALSAEIVTIHPTWTAASRKWGHGPVVHPPLPTATATTAASAEDEEKEEKGEGKDEEERRRVVERRKMPHVTARGFVA